MAVRIRLTRVGATKRPAYRVIAIDKRRSRDGRALEILGFYDPLTEPATVHLEKERIDAWIGKGAQPSDMVVRLMKQAEREAASPTPAEKPKRPTRPQAAAKPKAAKAKAAPAAAEDTTAADGDAAAETGAAEPAAQADQTATEAAAADSDSTETDAAGESPAVEATPEEAAPDEAASEAPAAAAEKEEREA